MINMWQNEGMPKKRFWNAATGQGSAAEAVSPEASEVCKSQQELEGGSSTPFRPKQSGGGGGFIGFAL